jgi:putative ABC transport system substrate-binding protein
VSTDRRFGRFRRTSGPVADIGKPTLLTRRRHRGRGGSTGILASLKVQTARSRSGIVSAPLRREGRMMAIGRRELIIAVGAMASSLARPLAARAQQSAMPVIGFLSARSPTADARLLVSLRQGLSESGFVEGRNVAVEYRYAKGQIDRLPSLASDLVRRHVAVIVSTGGVPGALAAKAATTTIPIVFSTGGDPVKEGLVVTLDRPGGNLTGVTTSFAEATSKRLGLLREIVPKAAAIGVLVNPSDPVTVRSETDGIRTAARSLGQRIEILHARTERDIDTAFVSLIDMRVDALLVAPDSLFATQANQLVALAARHAIPTLYWRREFVEVGGLMSYGSNLADALRVVGGYAGRILKGEKAGDLPVQQPTKFELVISLKTAKALGLIIPPDVLAIADEVIE